MERVEEKQEGPQDQKQERKTKGDADCGSRVGSLHPREAERRRIRQQDLSKGGVTVPLSNAQQSAIAAELAKEARDRIGISEADAACRCGWDGNGDHPCHAKGYTCRKPATARYLTYLSCLAGAQMKLGASQTFACDECWEKFKKEK